jgi:FkbM family methyltransferase
MGRKRPRNSETERLRVTESAEAGHGSRANVDGSPLVEMDSVQQRNATIDALRQRVEALTLRIPLDPSSRSAGLNAAFADDLAATRIFALHLNRLGVTRVLDVGSGRGRLGHQMRRFGYAGLIYSVEPRLDRYTRLLAAAALDANWVPLARKGAADKSGNAELPVAGASAAERGAPAEQVFVAKSSDLANDHVMRQVEALCINVQGMEAKILEGMGERLTGVRLVMFHGARSDDSAGDAFAIDAALVNSLGFTRATLAPARYDDAAGIARRYHGIYIKPDAQVDRQPGISIDAVVTSIGGSMKRLGADGSDVGDWWGAHCIASWSAFSGRLVSVSESPSGSGAVAWSECDSKPSIAELFRRMGRLGGGHHILTNADVYLTEALKLALPTLYPEVVYYGHRHEVRQRAGTPVELVTTGYYAGGFDYFILPEPFVNFVNQHNLIPETFLVGEPWWDYLIPLLALATGFACKKLPTAVAYALHYSHVAGRENTETYTLNGQRYIDLVQGIQQSNFSYARDFVASLLQSQHPEFTERLWQMAEKVCYALP